MPKLTQQIAAVVIFLAAPPSIAEAAPAYLRHPDLHADRIVFCAEGDLWLASDRGGTARRLTSHPGTESLPRFSPDGRSIAFTAEYDGNRDVFLLPSEGGEPRRLTWHPASDGVIGFTPDGARVIFRSDREQPNGGTELFTVAVSGGDAEKLPLGWADRIDVDPESGAWAFTRKSWESATWKRYRGGTAPDIWVGDPTKADFRKVTRFDGLNAFPMWHGGRIWFLSDQGGTANLWSMRPDGSERTRHTDFNDWDARWPAMAPDGRIVFSLGADLAIFEPPGGPIRTVAIDLPSDRALTRVRYPDPDKTISWISLSPDAERIAVTTRGEIFSVPVKEGVTLPVTRGSGARESWASFDGDGKRLVYVSDAPHEEELRIVDAWGRGEPKIVKPAGTSGWHFPPLFSPDGKWIAYGDQTQSLWIVPAAGGTPRLIDRSPQEEINEYAFSPDGRWLAYAKTLRTDYSSIHIYDTVEESSVALSGPTTSDTTPVWDPEGRYLYFLSDRATNPVLDRKDWGNVELRNDKLFLVLLRKDVPNPFAPSEGLPGKEDDTKKDTKKPKKKDTGKGKSKSKEKGKKKQGREKEDEDDDEDSREPTDPIEIDVEGLARRIVELPVERGSYSGLGATADKVFFLSRPVRGMVERDAPADDEEAAPEATLFAFDFEKKEAQPFVGGVSGFIVAPRADKIAILKRRGEIYVVATDEPPDDDLDEGEVSLDGIVLELDPREEWEQIYFEGWRHMRDFFWDPGMGGVGWTQVRDRYATLLPRLAIRDDLRDLMGEVIGELGNSHTYVYGGDAGVRVSRWSTGLLGADLKREGDAYRVVKIYRGDPADGVSSPLDEPGVGVREGEYILAVNHVPFDRAKPFEAALADRAETPVVLTVHSRPSREGAREVVVTPLDGEDELRYHDWVRTNREAVAAKSGGKLGYLHLPDMWTAGLVAFNTWFYPQLDKEGLVVDVRWNGGGAVSAMIVERLRRKVVSFERARGGGVWTYPARVLNGPFVVVTNEFAGSDGDIFPAVVQIEGLAPVIGMRSWGGVVGIRADKDLVDGGNLTQPEFAWWDPREGWSLENRGVIPDIEVQNLPQELARGTDAQLDRAIAELLRLREQKPPIEPRFGPVRDRSRPAFRGELP